MRGPACADAAIVRVADPSPQRNHYNELPGSLKQELGSSPAEFLHYFTSRFPQLLFHVYRFVLSSALAKETLFQRHIRGKVELFGE